MKGWASYNSASSASNVEYLFRCGSRVGTWGRIPPYFSPTPKITDRVSSLDGGNFYECYCWLLDARKSHLRSLFSKFSWGRPDPPSGAYAPLSNNLECENWVPFEFILHVIEAEHNVIFNSCNCQSSKCKYC
jgi:hypothetical protein